MYQNVHAPTKQHQHGTGEDKEEKHVERQRRTGRREAGGRGETRRGRRGRRKENGEGEGKRTKGEGR